MPNPDYSRRSIRKKRAYRKRRRAHNQRHIKKQKAIREGKVYKPIKEARSSAGFCFTWAVGREADFQSPPYRPPMSR